MFRVSHTRRRTQILDLLMSRRKKKWRRKTTTANTCSSQQSLSEWMQNRFRWYIRNKTATPPTNAEWTCEWVNAFFCFSLRLHLLAYFSHSARCTRTVSAFLPTFLWFTLTQCSSFYFRLARAPITCYRPIAHRLAAKRRLYKMMESFAASHEWDSDLAELNEPNEVSTKSSDWSNVCCLTN